MKTGRERKTDTVGVSVVEGGDGDTASKEAGDRGGADRRRQRRTEAGSDAGVRTATGSRWWGWTLWLGWCWDGEGVGEDEGEWQSDSAAKVKGRDRREAVEKAVNGHGAI